MSDLALVGVRQYVSSIEQTKRAPSCIPLRVITSIEYRFSSINNTKYYNVFTLFLSKNYKRDISLIQPGRNMSKLLNTIMTNYDRNIRPFYGGKREITVS